MQRTLPHAPRIVILILIGIASLPLASLAAPPYTISAKKDTVDRREGESQALPRGETRLSSSDVCYVFTFRPSSVQPPAGLEAQWVVLMESQDGRLHVATHGREALAPPSPGKSAEIRTDPIHLEEREWRGRMGRRRGSTEESLHGYAVRLVDATGVAVAEKYDPAKMQDRVNWEKPDQSGDPPANRHRQK